MTCFGGRRSALLMLDIHFVFPRPLSCFFFFKIVLHCNKILKSASMPFGNNHSCILWFPMFGMMFVLQLVELKSGETYNGHLMQCDSWMNMHLREVICSSKDGDRFWRMPEAYLRGNTIKFIRMSEETLELAKQNDLRREERRQAAGRGRGRGRGPGGRGRG